MVFSPLIKSQEHRFLGLFQCFPSIRTIVLTMPIGTHSNLATVASGAFTVMKLAMSVGTKQNKLVVRPVEIHTQTNQFLFRTGVFTVQRKLKPVMAVPSRCTVGYSFGKVLNLSYIIFTITVNGTTVYHLRTLLNCFDSLKLGAIVFSIASSLTSVRDSIW